MSKQSPQHTQAVIDYYDNTRVEYRLLWRNRHNLGLHFGYYDDTHVTHDQAVLNLNAQLAKLANITNKDKVLDAGCGVGGSSIWLAQHIGCKATGINVVQRQLERAEQNAAARGVTDRVDFVLADFAYLPFADASYTVFWGIESIVHAESKQAVLDEAFRVLGKGGRLVIAEYLLTSDAVSSQDQKLLRRWLDGWAMPDLKTEVEYKSMLQKAGFKEVKMVDWTNHMTPSFQRLEKLGKYFKPFVPLLSALRLANKDQRGNLSATEAQMELFRRGVWQYKVVFASK